MRCQDVVEVIVISDVSLVSGQRGKQVYNQIVGMSPHGACCRHNMPRVVNHGCFLLFIESRGWVPAQVRDLEVRWSRLKASLFHLSRVGALTLSNEVTPCKASGRMTIYVGWSGSFIVSACVWSVGSDVKNLGLLSKNHIINSPLHCQRRWWPRCGIWMAWLITKIYTSPVLGSS